MVPFRATPASGCFKRFETSPRSACRTMRSAGATGTPRTPGNSPRSDRIRDPPDKNVTVHASAALKDAPRGVVWSLLSKPGMRRITHVRLVLIFFLGGGAGVHAASSPVG